MLAPALVHRSWCAENPGHDSNERLEFLGDAVLGLIITDHAKVDYQQVVEHARLVVDTRNAAAKTRAGRARIVKA